MADIKITNMEEASLVLNRLTRRQQKHVVGMFAPAILHIWGAPMNEQGLIGKLLVPCAGTITKVAFDIPLVTQKNPAEISVQLDSENEGSLRKFTAQKERMVERITMEVKEGDLLSIYLVPSFVNVAFSAVFMPLIGEYNSEQYLMDNIEAKTDEGIRNSINKDLASRTSNGSSAAEK